nr:unnamed protein product [Spirometra erinaceieuropaei]
MSHMPVHPDPVHSLMQGLLDRIFQSARPSEFKLPSSPSFITGDSTPVPRSLNTMVAAGTKSAPPSNVAVTQSPHSNPTIDYAYTLGPSPLLAPEPKSANFKCPLLTGLSTNSSCCGAGGCIKSFPSIVPVRNWAYISRPLRHFRILIYLRQNSSLTILMIRRPVAKRQLSIEEAFSQSAKKSPNESSSEIETLPKAFTNDQETVATTGCSASNTQNLLDHNFDSFTWKNLHLLTVNEPGDVSAMEAFDVRLYETGYHENRVPLPTPATFIDAWDKDHVKMPCSPRSLYVENKVSVRRWDVIQRVLSEKIDSSAAFERAVNAYNNRYARTWNVDCLSAALQQRPDFVPLLQKIAELALRVPDLVTQPVPLLRQNKERSLSFSQLQIACLLANAFYSTFPRRNATGVNSEYFDFPTINFSSLFCGTGYADESNVEKIICLLHYFSRVFGEDGPPSGTVTFTRRCLHSPPDFSTSEVLVGSIPFGASSSCLIEDTQGSVLHVDFANRLLGGGVLHSGCVQEEILLCIAPELLIGRLFLEALLPHEAIVIFGAERFSSYTGYSRTFKWAGDFREAEHGTVRDKEGRWKKVVTVIDAVCFSDPGLQFQARFLRRELRKAYAGFTDIAAPYRSLPAIVVSGHWGCGAFNGNKALKALLQLMACAQAGKALAYSTFGEEPFAEKLLRVYDNLVSSNCTVGRLWCILTHLDPPDVQTDDELSEYVFKAVLQQLATAETGPTKESSPS